MNLLHETQLTQVAGGLYFTASPVASADGHVLDFIQLMTMRPSQHDLFPRLTFYTVNGIPVGGATYFDASGHSGPLPNADLMPKIAEMRAKYG